MENKERFLDLLSRRNELNSAENKELNAYLLDKEAAELYDTYTFSEKGVKSFYHPSVDEIGDYVLYLNNEQPEDSTILNKIPLIENHLRKCNNCNEIFLDFNSEHSEISTFMDANFASGKPAPQTSIISRSIRPLSFKYLTISSFAVLILFFGTLLVSNITTPPAYEFTGMNESSLNITRGRATDDFEQGLKALENNNFSEAVTFFENDISKHGNEKSVFYTSYILGLTYLKSAEKSFAGLFKSYDSEKVKHGIHYLETAIENNNSGEFPNVSYDAQFYIGKGYLMLNDKAKATGHFNSVIASKGSKMEEAKKILSELK